MKTVWLPAVPALVFLLAASSADAKLGPSPASLPMPAFPPALVALDAPATIAAGETMEGVSITRQPEPRITVAQPSRKGGRPVAMRPQAVDTRRSPAFETIAAGSGRCLTFEGNGTDVESNLSMMSNAGVVPIRSERLVEGSDGGMTLEVVEGWIDAGTMGARSVSKSTLPLAEIGGGGGDQAYGPALKVYGYRSAEGVEVVLPSAFSLTFRDAEGTVGSSRCGFLRLRLPAYKAAATVVAVGPLPAPPVTPVPAVAPAAAPEGDAPATRNVQVSISLSKVSRDPAPVLSVLVAWADDGTATVGAANAARGRSQPLNGCGARAAHRRVARPLLRPAAMVEINQSQGSDLRNAGNVVPKIVSGIRGADERLVEFVRERPVVAVCTALAAGYTIGRIVSRLC